jgi:hypothetical protein
VLAGATAMIAIGLFAYFAVSLRSGTSELRTEAAQLSR